MKITLSNLKRRWKINCDDNVAAFVDGAQDAGDAYATLVALNKMTTADTARGINMVWSGEVAAAIYGNVVFVRR
jgi:hypothetical protein